MNAWLWWHVCSWLVRGIISAQMHNHQEKFSEEWCNFFSCIQKFQESRRCYFFLVIEFLFFRLVAPFFSLHIWTSPDSNFFFSNAFWENSSHIQKVTFLQQELEHQLYLALQSLRLSWQLSKLFISWKVMLKQHCGIPQLLPLGACYIKFSRLTGKKDAFSSPKCQPCISAWDSEFKQCLFWLLDLYQQSQRC